MALYDFKKESPKEDPADDAIIKTARIDGREYRLVIRRFGQFTSTAVQVLVVFKDGNGWTWRNLPWWAKKRTEEVWAKAR